ncbi:MAG: hypothetical protein AB8G11_15810 [Saprospiraceae bacterium]
MKNIKYILLFIGIVTLSSCQDNTQEAANYICDCNKALVTHLAKLEKFKAENDVNSLAEAQPESERITKEARACYDKMQEEFGSNTMNDKDFEVKVLAIVKEQCPDVYQYRNQISTEE